MPGGTLSGGELTTSCSLTIVPSGGVRLENKGAYISGVYNAIIYIIISYNRCDLSGVGSSLIVRELHFFQVISTVVL